MALFPRKSILISILVLIAIVIGWALLKRGTRNLSPTIPACLRGWLCTT
jgi:hypothetical protein